jgi:electron transport complex protein RnfA
MKEVLVLVLSAVLVENFVLVKFLGICPFLGVSKKLKDAIGMGAAVIFVMALSSALAWLLNKYVLVSLGLEYLQTMVFILVIAVLVQFVETVLKKLSPALYKALGIYLPLISTNCAVLGVVLLNLERNYNFVESILYGSGGGIGFTLALVLYAGVRERMENTDIPEMFKGFPITLIGAALISVAFFGFKGLFS